MAAVMKASDFVESMNPEGLGDELLREWAPWARDDNEGGGHSWAVKPRVDRGYHGDPPDNFFKVNRIVAIHKREYAIFWSIVSRWWLGEMPVWLICRELDREDWWVKQKACWVAGIVEREFLDLANEADKVRNRRVRINRAC